MSHPRPFTLSALACTAFVGWLTLLPLTASATPQQALARYATQGATSPSPERGRQFFTSAHGQAWQCASCHGVKPVTPGRHAATGKAIAPMAPAVNAERFADEAKTEKWFRRNCRDVVGRECTPQEKADVVAWLSSLRP